MFRLLPMALFVLGVLVGCASAPPTPVPDLYSSHYEPKDSHGVLLKNFKEAALAISEGMTPDKVRELLGLPDETSQQMVGSKTSRPWDCQTWTYKFPGGGFMQPTSVFAVDFYVGDKAFVNDWHWATEVQ